MLLRWLHEDLKKSPEDILTLQRLEEEIIRLQASINSVKVGFIIVDVSGEITFLNTTARSMLGIKSPEEDPSIPFWSYLSYTLETITQELKPRFNFQEQITTCINERKYISMQDVSINHRVLHIKLFPISFESVDDPSKGRIIGVTVLLEDVTEERIVQRSRDEFFSIASHELRTPLTAIRGNASLIQEYYKDLLAEERDLKDMVSDIYASSIRLIQIVNDFLDISRLEQKRMKFDRELFNLFDIVEEVIHAEQATVRERGLTLQLDKVPTGTIVPYVIADKERTRQVLYNLIGNAIKYTPHGTITVSLQKDGYSVLVRVADTGQGIPAHNQELLFHKFQQAGDNLYTRDAVTGTGLGLYISKLLAEQMGGTVYLEQSVEKKGSVFGFTLPAANDREISTLLKVTEEED